MNTITVPRKVRLAAYLFATLCGYAVSLLGLLAVLFGYSHSKWWLAVGIAWPTIHSCFTALAAGNIPALPDASNGDASASAPTAVPSDASSNDIEAPSDANQAIAEAHAAVSTDAAPED